MAQYLNIGGDKNDSSYRYKMPKLVTKVEGRGNGIKTVIVNMVDVSKALHIDPAYTTKFFGYELGAQSKFSTKTERAVVNGKFEASDMQKRLEGFIEQFILCPKCGLPEITMKVRKEVKIDCAACGCNGLLATKHKLVGYIVKQHKELKAKKKAGKEGKGKKGKKTKKGGDDAEEDKEDEEVVEEAQKVKVKKEKVVDAEVVWHTDTSKEAQEERKHQEFKEMTEGQEDSKAIMEKIIAQAGSVNVEDPVVVLKIFMLKDPEVDQVCSELKRLQMSRGLDEPQKLKVLLEALLDFTDPKNVHLQYGQHKEILKRFTKDKKQALILIGCIEEQVGITHAELLPRVALILQQLYDNDVLDEKVLLTWHESPPESSWLSSKEVATIVRARAKPLIDWLKSAEESSDEEE